MEKSSPSSDRRRTEVDDRRRKAPADSRSTEGRENHKKPERATADSPGRRSPQLSESERERLESRKRKVEIGDSIDPLKRVGGKIRLRVCDSGDSERKDSAHSPEEPPEKKLTPPPPKSPVRLNGKEIRLRDVKEVAESEPKEKESKDRKAEKKGKRTKDKKKKDKDKRKTPDLKVVPGTLSFLWLVIAAINGPVECTCIVYEYRNYIFLKGSYELAHNFSFWDMWVKLALYFSVIELDTRLKA